MTRVPSVQLLSLKPAVSNLTPKGPCGSDSSFWVLGFRVSGLGPGIGGGGIFLGGVSMIRIKVFWGLLGGSPFWGTTMYPINEYVGFRC